MGLERVQALVDPRNEASRRIVDEQGFEYEGIFREYEYGEYSDLDIYSLLKCARPKDGAP